MTKQQGSASESLSFVVVVVGSAVCCCCHSIAAFTVCFPILVTDGK